MIDKSPGKDCLLHGGNTTETVKRVGKTVRRSWPRHSKNVHALLQHLAEKGFSQAPQFLGRDEQGCEILSFLPGETDMPEDIWCNDKALIASAQMLRLYHDCTIDFQAPNPMDWAFIYPDAARHEVIGHSDFAPYNMVFENGVPIGIFDFDLAGPQPRLRDIAYLAFWMVPLSFASPDREGFARSDMVTGSKRLKQFCATYGIEANAALLDMVTEFLHHMGDEAAMTQMLGSNVAQKLKQEGHLDHWQAEHAEFCEKRSAIQANLSG